MVALHTSSNNSVASQTFSKTRRKKNSSGRVVDERRMEDPDLLTRTSWVSAKVALNEVKKGKATGNRAALWLRSKMQEELFCLGNFIQTHAGKVLFVGVLVLLAFCVGLKSAKMETRIEKLWVEEGGRLEKELDYVESHLGVGAGDSNEMVIQTPTEDAGTSTILTPEALLSHLQILRAATKVVVEREDTAWKLKDLCYAQTIPLSENIIMEGILENLFPCAIITPLDCFWEGSKLLGTDLPVRVPLGGEDGSMLLSWTTLNPMQLIRQMSSFAKVFNMKDFEEYMKTAGITTGYQEKPCLDPYDPDCPSTAPNKNSKQKPDIGAELTGGCYGFATRYNHWPEALVVGGTSKNKSGHIVRAKGLQSVVQLMGEKDMYDYWSETWKTQNMDWSPEKAKGILAEWQSKFSQEVRRLSSLSKKYDINAFSTSNLDSVMEEFSEFSLSRVAIGYAFMLLYAGVTLFRWTDVVQSQSGLGIGGVILVTVSIAGGLGLCALLGITFNATTSQIVPFLALGLGLDAMFVLVQNYAEQLGSGTIVLEDQIGEVLSRTGVLILLVAVCIMAAFLLSAALIPIPAMRGLGFQAAILAAFNLVTMIFLFPALLALDLRRVASDQMDLLCCYTSTEKKRNLCKTIVISEKQREFCHNCSLSWFATNHFGVWLTKTPVKMLLTVLYIALTLTGIWGVTKVEDGLSLTDVVPRNTSVFKFLQAQDKYFGFYNMYAVTQDNFEYPQNQKVLYDYHNAFVRNPNIIKDDNGGLPEFWLSLFRTWLVKIQTEFDDNFAAGNYHSSGWHPNATDEGILGFKLMVQTGHVDYPVDLTLQTRNRLVDTHGIINPNAFYNYLSAWYSNDAMAYSFSQANIVPKPKDWVHNAQDEELRVPKSHPITFAQIPFYLNNLGDTEVMVRTIRLVRELCAKFEREKGFPNFPRGIPFTFWEQYLTLRFWLLVALGSILAAIFFIVTFVFMSAWTGLIAVSVIALLVLQLFGFMGIVGIRLSAIPAVLLILAAGLGVQFTVHILMGFASSVGHKNKRVLLSLKHMLGPVVHGAISTFLGIIMLAFSDFDFIYRYFFLVLTALILLGLLNGLVFLPIVLSCIGPPAEVIPLDKGDLLSPVTPPPPVRPSAAAAARQHLQIGESSSSHRSSSSSNRLGNIPRRHNSDDSLTTIAEESHSYVSSSQQSNDNNSLQTASLNGTSVILEPRVTVETTTTTYPNGNSSNSCQSSRCSTPTSQVTKVTATAKFKVEVHTPLSSSSKRSTSSSSRRAARKATATNTCLSSSSSEGATTNLQPVESSSASSSVSSSLSSNEGDLGFSEK